MPQFSNFTKPLVFIAIFIFSAFIFSGFNFKGWINKIDVKAAVADNVTGFAWSDNIGWVSFNCIDTSCAASNYGVNLNVDNTLSGYAWSDSVGWISFNAPDVAGCPAGVCQPRYDSGTGQVLGWAKALVNGGGWDGWISLNCSDKGVCGTSNYKVTISGTNFLGDAWGGDVIGWFKFNPALGGVFVASSLPPAAANVLGFAWSENIGWLSFNSNNCDPDKDNLSEGGVNNINYPQCPDGVGVNSYGVNLNADNTLSGFAWSDNIGWVSFNAADIASCPGVWYSPAWIYRKYIPITGSAGAGTGYQVKIQLGESGSTTGTNVNVDGHSLSAAIFNDIRFTASDGTTELSYWQESVTGAAPNRIATYWVKVSADLGTNQNIYLYYGNASAVSLSNGTSTFNFFDDFDGIGLDSKWSSIGSPAVSVSGSELTISSWSWSNDRYIKTASYTDNQNVAMRVNLKENALSGKYPSDIGWGTFHGGSDNTVQKGIQTTAQFRLAVKSGVSSSGAGAINMATTYKTYDLTWLSNKVELSENGVPLGNVTTNIPNVSIPITIGMPENGGGSWGWSTSIPWILVRKYVATEPGIGSSGSEQVEGSCQPSLVGNDFFGWARALSSGGGWDGWISLNCANSGVCGGSNYKVSKVGSDFTGWAWGGDVVGWVSFNSRNCDTDINNFIDVACGGNNTTTAVKPYKVYLANSSPVANTLSVTSPTSAALCTSGAAYDFQWTFSDSGDTESKFQIQVDNNSDFSSPSVDRTFSGLNNADGSANIQSILLTSSADAPNTDKLSYGIESSNPNPSLRAYYWRVQVWDSVGASSGWTSPSIVSFTTPAHMYPTADFTCSPSSTSCPSDHSQFEPIDFTDKSIAFGGAAITTRGWTFGDGSPSSSAPNPTHSYTSQGSFTTTLSVTDSSNFTCPSSININISAPSPKWKEVTPQ